MRITFEADKRLRRAIRLHYGQPGLATYEEVKSHFISYGHSIDDDILCELEEEDAPPQE